MILLKLQRKINNNKDIALINRLYIGIIPKIDCIVDQLQLYVILLGYQIFYIKIVINDFKSKQTKKIKFFVYQSFLQLHKIDVIIMYKQYLYMCFQYRMKQKSKAMFYSGGILMPAIDLTKNLQQTEDPHCELSMKYGYIYQHLILLLILKM